MKIAVLLFICCFVSVLLAAAAPICYPHFAVGDGKIWIGYGSMAYMYGLRGNLELSRNVTETYADRTLALCGPASFKPSGWQAVYFQGDGASNPTPWLVSTTTGDELRPYYDANVKLPQAKPFSNCTNLTWWRTAVSMDSPQYSIKWCYEYDATTGSRVVKYRNETAEETIALNDGNTATNYIERDSASGHLNLVTTRSNGWGTTTNYQFHVLSVDPLRIISSGAELKNTESSGCPTAPVQCVPYVPSVLLEFKTYNDKAVWLWSNLVNNEFVVHLDTYDSVCKEYNSVILGQSTGITRTGCADEDPNPPSNGVCNGQACCDATANPNYQTGSGFQKYNPACKNGGIGCVGTSGCQLCWRKSSNYAVPDGRSDCGF